MSNIVLLDERLVPLYTLPRDVGAALGLRDRQRPYISDIVGHVYQGKDCMVRLTEDPVLYKTMVDLHHSESIPHVMSHRTIKTGGRTIYLLKQTAFQKPSADRMVAIHRFEPLISERVNANHVCESVSDPYDRTACVASMEDLAAIYRDLEFLGYPNVAHVPGLVVENGTGLVLSAVLVDERRPHARHF
jgi:hypothetical protein